MKISLMSLFEDGMVKIQNATGFPIWRYCATGWQLWAAILFLSRIIPGIESSIFGKSEDQLFKIFSIFIAISVFWNWTGGSNVKQCRAHQDKADRMGMIVRGVPSFISLIIRLYAWTLIGTVTWALIYGSAAENVNYKIWCLRDFLFLFISYAMSCNYHPFTGSTIFEQIKTGLKNKSLAS